MMKNMWTKFISGAGAAVMAVSLLIEPVHAVVNTVVVTDEVFLTAEKDSFGDSMQQALVDEKMPLASYTEITDGQTLSAGDLIWAASQNENFGLNPRILLATLYIKQGLQLPAQGKFSPFVSEMATKLNTYFTEFQVGKRDVTLRNGQIVTFDQSINAGSYAIARYFSDMVDQESNLNTYLDQWVKAYQKFFKSDPRVTPQSKEPKALGISMPPFLILPFKQPDGNFYKINSFFDHSSPGTFDDYILRFDGKAYTGGSFNNCQLTISCYAGHNALDYSTPDRTPLFAAAAGRVVYKYFNKDATAGMVDSGLIIDHGNGYRTLYWHLDEQYLKLGDTVTQGQPIGLSGNIGRSSGAHLHFGLRKTSGSKDIDPFGWASKLGDPWGDSFFAFQGGQTVDNRSANAQLFYNRYWYREARGYSGESWWTYSMTDPLKSTNWAMWSTYLAAAGDYNVYVYYPKDSTATTSAAYQIYYGGNISTVKVNQSAGGDQWQLLGTYNFNRGSAVVMLTDLTTDLKKRVYFDAVKWVLKSAVPTPTASVSAGAYDDTNANIAYSGNWSSYTNVTGPYQKTYHLSGNIGDTYRITFIGTQVSMLYKGGATAGSWSVDIDGTYIGVMDQKTTLADYQKIWKSPLLAAGTHTITFEHTGTGSTDLDGIIVLNSSAATAIPTGTPTRTTAPTSTPTKSTTPTKTLTPQVVLTGGPTPTNTLPVCTTSP